MRDNADNVVELAKRMDTTISDDVRARVALPFTHTGLADAFALARGNDSRYVVQLGRWVHWDNVRWRVDEKRNLLDHFSEIARKQADEVDDVMALTGSKLLGLRRELLSHGYRAGAEAIARTMPRFTLLATELDTQPHLLNTPAGTIDLRTGEIRKHNRADLLTKCTSVAPSPKGIIGTRFATFLDEITLGDSALADYLRLALGACLFAANAPSASGDHWLLFFIGFGRNGKNTLMDPVRLVMGDYAKTIPTSTLMEDDRGHRHPTELANLLGVRLAICSETEDKHRWSEAKIKALTGDANIAARFMRQDFFEFPRTHRHVVYGNHRPTLANPDIAIRSRLHVVPFRACFEGREDTALPAKLIGEAPAILEWLLSGAADYFEAGRLRPCEAVQRESSDYFESQSTFDMWLAEMTEPDDGSRTPSKDLYASFKRWKEERGEGVPSQTRWGEEMARRYAKDPGGRRLYIGVRLRNSLA